MSAAETVPEYASRDALRAMGHPLRLEILQFFRHNEFGRAKDLAEYLGVPANSVSYHLRILARAGLIEDAPEHGRDKRDRTWRIASSDGPFIVDSSERQPEYVEAIGELGLAALEWLRAGWIAEADMRHDPDDVGRANIRVSLLRLTDEEAKKLNREFCDLLYGYTKLHRDERGHDLPGEEGVSNYRVASVVIASR